MRLCEKKTKIECRRSDYGTVTTLTSSSPEPWGCRICESSACQAQRSEEVVHSEVRRQSRGQAAPWLTKQAQPSECSKLFIHDNGTNKNDQSQRHLWSGSHHKCNKQHEITEKIVRFSDVSTKAQIARRLLCCRFSGGSINLYLHLQVTVCCLILFLGLKILYQVNMAMNFILFQPQSFKKSS